jgi:hypothetical protein
MVLASHAAGETNAASGAAVTVYADGDLLTSYHLIKNAYAVQVRFKSGEVFDRVKLLGFDERRDIAAIRITASGLPVLPVASASEANPGDPVISIFHPAAQPWCTSTGVLSAYRLADEIPGAGTGFRVFQFTSPASPGAAGSILVDSKGRLLGITAGSIDGGQNLNFAVPIENVIGLADTPPVKTFASGALLMPGGAIPLPAPVISASVAPAPAVQPVLDSSTTPAAQTPQKPEDIGAALNASKDREFILRHMRTMYVDTSHAIYFSNGQMKASLARNKDFAALHISIVDDPKAADALLVVGHSAVWDFPFELKHQASSIVLLAGKGLGPLSGILGANNVASELVKAATPYRIPPAKQ